MVNRCGVPTKKSTRINQGNLRGEKVAEKKKKVRTATASWNEQSGKNITKKKKGSGKGGGRKESWGEKNLRKKTPMSGTKEMKKPQGRETPLKYGDEREVSRKKEPFTYYLSQRNGLGRRKNGGATS